jgi:tetraacyldisaccharide 4'-kinase
VKDLRRNIVIKIILFPLSLLYGLIIDLRNWLFDNGIFKKTFFSVPVVSVGNITTGGTGKTPFTMLLIDLLSPYFTKIVVVSRGYGRRSKGIKIVSDGVNILVPVEESGDEPYLIARKYPSIPVIVSERRVPGIKVAENQFGADVVLLDDAFQHRGAHRDCDIVLINSQNDIDREHVLPLGNLRENLKHLRRANILIFTGSESDEAQDYTYDNLKVDSDYVFNCIFKVESLVDKDLKPVGDLSVLNGKCGVAFTAIADPTQFLTTLQANQIQLDAFLTFPDHHFYTKVDYGRLAEVIQKHRSDYLITTEKDLVRIDKSYLNKITVVGLRRTGVITDKEKFKIKLREFIDFKM